MIERLYQKRWWFLIAMFLAFIIFGVALNTDYFLVTFGTPVCTILVLGVFVAIISLWVLLHVAFVLSRHRRSVPAPVGAYREMVGSAVFILLCLRIAARGLDEIGGFHVFWQRLTGG